MQPDRNRRRYQQIFDSLVTLSRKLLAGLELDQLLRDVCREVASLVSADSCAIMLFDADRESLLTAASAGLSAEEERQIRFERGQGVAGWVAAQGLPAQIPDVLDDWRFEPIPWQALRIRSLVCVPLQTHDDVIGTVTVTSPDRDAFDESDVDLLGFLAESIVVDLDTARLQRLAVTDSLTGLPNWPQLTERLETMLATAAGQSSPLSVLLLHCDHLAATRKALSPAAGDELLQQVAGVLAAQIRDVDLLARERGGTFGLLLPGIEGASAVRYAERLRQLAQQHLGAFQGQPLATTASCGVCSATGNTTSGAELLEQARGLLRDAIGAGGNCVRGSGGD